MAHERRSLPCRAEANASGSHTLTHARCLSFSRFLAAGAAPTQTIMQAHEDADRKAVVDRLLSLVARRARTRRRRIVEPCVLSAEARAALQAFSEPSGLYVEELRKHPWLVGEAGSLFLGGTVEMQAASTAAPPHDHGACNGA